MMMDENVKSYDSGSYYGEVDIENIASRTIEARSKDLVPVFDNSRTPMSQQLRSDPVLIAFQKILSIQL